MSGVWHAVQAAKTSGGREDYGLTLNYLAISPALATFRARHFTYQTSKSPTKFSPILTRTLVTTSNEKSITPIFPSDYTKLNKIAPFWSCYLLIAFFDDDEAL